MIGWHSRWCSKHGTWNPSTHPSIPVLHGPPLGTAGKRQGASDQHLCFSPGPKTPTLRSIKVSKWELWNLGEFPGADSFFSNSLCFPKSWEEWKMGPGTGKHRSKAASFLGCLDLYPSCIPPITQTSSPHRILPIPLPKIGRTWSILDSVFLTALAITWCDVLCLTVCFIPSFYMKQMWGSAQNNQKSLPCGAYIHVGGGGYTVKKQVKHTCCVRC